MPQNPYGGNPGSGLQFPPYYKPMPSVRSRNNYFPGRETLGPDARPSNRRHRHLLMRARQGE